MRKQKSGGVSFTDSVRRHSIDQREGLTEENRGQRMSDAGEVAAAAAAAARGCEFGALGGWASPHSFLCSQNVACGLIL